MQKLQQAKDQSLDQSPISSRDLPAIPEKRYFTIGEVSTLCAVKPHVLRYWEQEFRQLRPSKRRGNRRYDQHKDVMMIRKIRSLLYEQGYTIGGARLQLSGKPAKQEKPPADMRDVVNDTIRELESLLEDLR